GPRAVRASGALTGARAPPPFGPQAVPDEAEVAAVRGHRDAGRHQEAVYPGQVVVRDAREHVVLVVQVLAERRDDPSLEEIQPAGAGHPRLLGRARTVPGL